MHIIYWITKQYIGTVETSKIGTLVYNYYLISIPVNGSDRAIEIKKLRI